MIASPEEKKENGPSDQPDTGASESKADQNVLNDETLETTPAEPASQVKEEAEAETKGDTETKEPPTEEQQNEQEPTEAAEKPTEAEPTAVVEEEEDAVEFSLQNHYELQQEEEEKRDEKAPVDPKDSPDSAPSPVVVVNAKKNERQPMGTKKSGVVNSQTSKRPNSRTVAKSDVVIVNKSNASKKKASFGSRFLSPPKARTVVNTKPKVEKKLSGHKIFAKKKKSPTIVPEVDTVEIQLEGAASEMEKEPKEEEAATTKSIVPESSTAASTKEDGGQKEEDMPKEEEGQEPTKEEEATEDDKAAIPSTQPADVELVRKNSTISNAPQSSSPKQALVGVATVTALSSIPEKSPTNTTATKAKPVAQAKTTATKAKPVAQATTIQKKRSFRLSAAKPKLVPKSPPRTAKAASTKKTPVVKLEEEKKDEETSFPAVTMVYTPSLPNAREILEKVEY